MRVGEVVESLAGRDQGSLGVVVRTDDRYVYVCDGKERRLKSPKRKNPRHVGSVPALLSEQEMRSDSALRRALARIRDSR